MIEQLQKFHNEQIYTDRHGISPEVADWSRAEGVVLSAVHVVNSPQNTVRFESYFEDTSTINTERYPYLTDLVQDIDELIRQQIVSELDDFTQRNNPIRLLENATEIPFDERKLIRENAEDQNKPAEIGRNRQIFLEHLFNTDEVSELAIALESEYVQIKHSPQLLDHQAVDNLIRLMLPNSQKFGFQLAFLLSIIPQPDIPELHEYLNLKQTKDDAKIVLDKLEWYLCEAAEDRFEDSLDKGAVILVSDNILMKVKGKMTGLCINSFLTESGHGFVEGHMYSPLNIQARNQIKRAFDQGKGRIDLENDVWGYMREYKDFDGSGFEDVVKNAKEYASKAPDRLPERIDGMTRKQFRLDEQEAHT